ncbi:PD-(D/E)XK nuclease family protein [Aliarcobacter cryaerophilus]|uniref:PDDEXK-like family protein n=1 Tax=Aliarcobacter cryaerophilus TaxID=28198 RepID=UPI003DA46B01
MNNENINFKELENTLIKLYGKIEIIEELQKHRGDKFNIFSILKMERLEVKTHSAFLYELINLNGTHYQDDKYLRIFIDEVLKIEDFDFKNVKVGRETLIDADRKIDFTIENDDYYIAIEMKIDATDQYKQLSDYFKYTKKQAKKFKKLYYLTLDGKDASEKSFKDKKTIDYEKISFQFHILNFIEKSIEKSANLPIIRESLIQYQNLILNITNQTRQELQMESIKFINTPEMAKAATYMSKNLSYAWAKREVLFWRYLAIKLEKYLKDKKNWELKQEIFYDENENIIDFDDEIVRWIVEDLGKNDMRGLFLQKNDFCFYIYSYDGGILEYRIEKKQDINNIWEKIGISKSYKEMKFKETKYALNFCKNSPYPTYDIFDKDKLDEIVENIFNEIKSYMDIIVKELN